MEDTETKPVQKNKPKKSVGFAPPPVEELKEHHAQLAKKEKEELKSNPFHKVPPELAYLEKNGPDPKAVIPRAPAQRKGPSYGLSDIGDLRYSSIKDISVQNKETELNFNYPLLDLLIGALKVLVDTKYASLNSFDLSKINKYLLNLSNTKLGLGYDFAGRVIKVGSGIKNYAVGDFVFGLVDPYSRKGSLSTSILVNPWKDILIKIEEEDWEKLQDIEVNLSFEREGEEEFQVEDLEPQETNTEPQEEPHDENTGPVVGNNKEEEEEEDKETEKNEEAEAEKKEEEDKKENKKDDIPNLENATEEISLDPVDTQPKKTKHVFKKPARKFSEPTFKIDPEITPLAKLATFPALYCRAKQVLEHLQVKNNLATVLINGADTNLGLTLIQILASSVYSLDRLNLILIIREKSYEQMENFASNLTKGALHDASRITKYTLVTHDMVNEDLVLKGEKAATNYKKIDFFASQVIEGLFKTQYYDDDNLIGTDNINKYKLDLFVDIVGSKKYFQRTIHFDKLDSIALPVHKHTNGTLEQIFNGKVAEPFLVKLLKPKKSGSSFVSCCRFNVSEPSYSIDRLVDYSESAVNPWASKWSSNLFNTMTYYNYYDEIELRAKKEWVTEGFRLLMNDKLKFKIDYYTDWRNGFKAIVKEFKESDGKALFKVEDF